MALIKLINVGEEPFIGMYDGMEYVIYPSGGSVLVEEGIAKHWFGDWDIADPDRREAESKRVAMLNYRDATGAPAKFNIKMERIVMQEKPQTAEVPLKKEVIINPSVTPPKEKEFSDLANVEAIATKTRKRASSITSDEA